MSHKWAGMVQRWRVTFGGTGLLAAAPSEGCRRGTTTRQGERQQRGRFTDARHALHCTPAHAAADGVSGWHRCAGTCRRVRGGGLSPRSAAPGDSLVSFGGWNGRSQMEMDLLELPAGLDDDGGVSSESSGSLRRGVEQRQQPQAG